MANLVLPDELAALRGLDYSPVRIHRKRKQKIAGDFPLIRSDGFWAPLAEHKCKRCGGTFAREMFSKCQDLCDICIWDESFPLTPRRASCR